MNNYFDYAASTPVAGVVLEAMTPWLQENFSNPSSSHRAGTLATAVIENARKTIADKIGAMPSEIIFTSGASESNNLAIKGIAFNHLKNKGHIITSQIEHKCILNACVFLEKLGFDITYLSPNSDGEITPESLSEAIRENTILISIHHVNNELGTIQPIAEFGAIAFEHDIPFHTDAAQSFCKLSIDADDMDIDMLSLSGHKIYGPKGIGALYVRNARESNLVPLIHGGGQEGGLRGGTSPTPLIVGLGAAVANFPHDKQRHVNKLASTLSNYAYFRNGGKQVVSTTWNITFANEDEKKKFLTNHKWAISQGSACNSMTNAPSHVLSSIGFDEAKARLTYRISLPPYSLDTE
jgi:cysteine desulfurase